ncbi:MAG TPA: hypothetical protein DCM21_08445 [Butyrivibrio sp.]|nr:hypothetical protein [Butyrivibrio sp.]
MLDTLCLYVQFDIILYHNFSYLPKTSYLAETARANKLNVYYYIRHLLTELPNSLDENGNIEQSQLEPLMPWSKELPVDCYSKCRN